jgi:shikimate dehydrogenase
MARAAVAAALQGRARRVTLCARDLEGANSLVQEMLARWQGPLPQVATRALADAGGSLARADVLVQATSLGMEPEDPLPLDLETALPRLFVLDAVYGAGESALLSRARAHGLRVADGRCLLLHQGMAAFTLWTGVAAPIAAMRRAIAA